MSDEQMFQVILDTMSRTDARLDEYAKETRLALGCLHDDVGKIHTTLAGQKVKISSISGGVALAVSVAMAWLMNLMWK